MVVQSKGMGSSLACGLYLCCPSDVVDDATHSTISTRRRVASNLLTWHAYPDRRVPPVHLHCRACRHPLGRAAGRQDGLLPQLGSNPLAEGAACGCRCADHTGEPQEPSGVSKVSRAPGAVLPLLRTCTPARLPRTLLCKHDLLIVPWDFIIIPTCCSVVFDALFSYDFLQATVAS